MSEADVSLEAAPGAADESRRGRLAAIDLARGVAIAAMVVYHTAYDLSAERLIAVDIVDDIRWRVFARLIAGTFLMLVGVSLVLATRDRFNRTAYLRRLALIVGGAALVSLGTWWFDPPTFVFFGILHEIAVASVLALPFLRLPSVAVLVAAAAVFAAPAFLTSDAFNAWPLLWVGLSTAPRITVDYVPVLPWFGMVLCGIVAGRVILHFGDALRGRQPPSSFAARALATAGRWSLPIYLVHQPLIVGAISLLAMWMPPSRAMVGAGWTNQCIAACVPEGRTREECVALCGCMFDGIYGTDLFSVTSLEAMNAEQTQRWQGIVDRCVVPPPANQ